MRRCHRQGALFYRIGGSDQGAPSFRRYIASIAIAVVLGAAIVGDLLGTRAHAQPPQRPVIRVVPMMQAEPASSLRLTIEIGPRQLIAAGSFIRIRGLPPMVALSEAHAIAPGSWAVSLTDLANLTVILPAGQQGRSDIVISLVNADGSILAEATTALVVAAVPAASSASQPPSPPAVASMLRILDPADQQRALGLHAKGREQLEHGNVYAARRFFERATEIGLAQSAVALADTYDPNELAKRTVIGIQPDIDAARKWYEKARELGAVEASDRLRRLGSR